MKVRIYGKTLKIWMEADHLGRQGISQTEKAYVDYDSENLEVLGMGSEDFSPVREERELERRWVWIWRGKYNKGKKRWFDCYGLIQFRKSEKKAVKEMLKYKYNANDIQLR